MCGQSEFLNERRPVSGRNPIGRLLDRGHTSPRQENRAWALGLKENRGPCTPGPSGYPMLNSFTPATRTTTTGMVFAMRSDQVHSAGVADTCSSAAEAMRADIQAAAAADHGEQIGEVCGPHPRVDHVHGRCVKPCIGRRAMVSPTKDKAVVAASQVQRRTGRDSAEPLVEKIPSIELSIAESENLSAPATYGQAVIGDSQRGCV